MVEFKRLLLLPKRNGLYIDVEVPNMPYNDNIYLDRIYIDTHDTFRVGGVSMNPVYSHTIDGNKKKLQITIPLHDVLVKNCEGQLFFVYIITKGIFAADTPCGMDEHATLGVICDTAKIYRQGIKYIQETYERCEVPRHFIDFILRYNAFKICLQTRDYPLAIAYWKRFIGTNNKAPSTKGCGCHG